MHGDHLLHVAAQACPLFSALLEKALDLIRGCDCVVDSGCPGCIQHTGCSQYNAVRSLFLREAICYCNCSDCWTRGSSHSSPIQLGTRVCKAAC